MQAAEINEAALQLSDEEKTNLVVLILDSLGGADPNDSDDDSLSEAIRRGDEIRSGSVDPIPEAEFMKLVRSDR
jgi:hypothetical protein